MFFSDGQDKFSVLLRGTADAALTRSLPQTNEACGLEMFAILAVVVSLGRQLRGNNAAAGASISASSRPPAVYP